MKYRSEFSVLPLLITCLVSGGASRLQSAHAAERGEQDAKGLPFQIRSGVEIARQPDTRPASLKLICSESRKLHLLLLTRLPGPRWAIQPGQDNNVSLFVDGIEQELPITVDVVDKGDDPSWLVRLWAGEAAGPLDTIVTPPLSDSQITTLENWFGTTPPEKVSVVGIFETGTFMKGSASGQQIREQSAACAL